MLLQMININFITHDITTVAGIHEDSRKLLVWHFVSYFQNQLVLLTKRIHHDNHEYIMIPRVSRFHMVMWLLVMCRSHGAKWQFSGHVHVADPLFCYDLHIWCWYMYIRAITVKDKLNCCHVCVPVTSIFALNQHYFTRTPENMGTPKSTRVKMQNLVAG